MKSLRRNAFGAISVAALMLAGAPAAADLPAGSAQATATTTLNSEDFWVRRVTPAMIQAQLDAGVDINQTNEAGDSAMVQAGNAMAGEDMWRFLIEKGADVTAKLHDSRPAIFWVTKGGTPDAVRFVMKQKGVDINAVDSVGRNALAHATRLQPDLQVYRLLVDAGIDVKRRDENGRTAMHEAAMRSSYVHVFEYLATIGLNYSDLDSNGWDAFLNAAWRNPNYDVVRFLAKKSDIRRTGKDGLNAAMLAAENNPSGPVFTWLLEQGLSVDGKDVDGATALIRAGRNSAAVARQLVARGQSINAADNKGNTAFLNAARAQTYAPELFALLKSSGVNVHAVNKQGENALMIALENRSEKDNGPTNVLMLLTDYGLSPRLKNKVGDGALSLAARARQPRRVLEALVKAGLDVNVVDSNSWTPLMYYAAKGYDVDAIDYLISAGADPKKQNRSGETALKLALKNASLRDTKAITSLQP